MSNCVQSWIFSPAARSCTRGGRFRGPKSGPRPPPPVSAGLGLAGARAISSAGGGGALPEAELLAPPLLSMFSAGGRSVSGDIPDPALLALGSADALILGSRGCALRFLVCGMRTSLSNHRHSPSLKLWSLCHLGRGGTRAQPLQVHSGSGSTSGYLHTPRTRQCSLRVEATPSLQPLSLIHI